MKRQILFVACLAGALSATAYGQGAGGGGAGGAAGAGVGAAGASTGAAGAGALPAGQPSAPGVGTGIPAPGYGPGQTTTRMAPTGVAPNVGTGTAGVGPRAGAAGPSPIGAAGGTPGISSSIGTGATGGSSATLPTIGTGATGGSSATLPAIGTGAMGGSSAILPNGGVGIGANPRVNTGVGTAGNMGQTGSSAAMQLGVTRQPGVGIGETGTIMGPADRALSQRVRAQLLAQGLTSGKAANSTAAAANAGVLGQPLLNRQDLSNVQITSNNGVVTMRGRINNEAQRLALENQVRRMTGVQAVIDGLTVTGPGTTSGATSTITPGGTPLPGVSR